jgi:DNA (cytosine-5)-methyltransferase 1
MRRIKATPARGGWRDWPNKLRLQCHKRKSGQTFPSVYGRMAWDELGPTITTQCYGLGNGRFGHPEQHRAISLREAALLQTFPRDYQFVEPGQRITFKQVGRHIGNAIPVRLAEAIALSVIRHLQEAQAAESSRS